MTTYLEHGLTITQGQLKKILTAGKQGKSLTIRISKKNLHGDNMLLLTKTQINKIMKSTSGLDLTLSPPQVKKIYKKFVELQNEHKEKTGGILPLLALLPLIFGGLGAAGGISGGIASAVSSAKNANIQNQALAENIRHNKEIESQLKTGSGYLSNIAGKIPVFGNLLKLGLEKLGFGFYLDPKGGDGLYLDPQGNGFSLIPRGKGFFLDPRPR